VSSNIEKGKMGMYARWLLSLYNNGRLRLEDLYKATEYFPVFEKLRLSNKLTPQQKDMYGYKSLPDMYDVV
jgi:hypothetical protein